MYAIWISITTLVAAGYSMTTNGPLFLKDRVVDTQWAPWQVAIAVAINALLIVGVIAVMSRFGA